MVKTDFFRFNLSLIASYWFCSIDFHFSHCSGGWAGRPPPAAIEAAPGNGTPFHPVRLTRNYRGELSVFERVIVIGI